MPDHLLYTSISLGLLGLVIVSRKIRSIQILFAIFFSLWITMQVVFGAGNIARQAMDRRPPGATEEYTRVYLEGVLQAQARLHLYKGSLLTAAWAVTILCLVRSSNGDVRSAGVGARRDGKRGGE